ncbi:MAG: class I SAM-dependent methyltransferase [Phycisphaerales bacterium]
MDPAPAEAKPHSAEFFNEMRDHWWHADFLELMAKRLALGEVRRVLDVGCGVGHWSRSLAPVLSPEATVVGIDREPRWVKEAGEAAARLGLQPRFTYRQGDAFALPFDDGVFDFVTCQTVLIHLSEPSRGSGRCSVS